MYELKSTSRANWSETTTLSSDCPVIMKLSLMIVWCAESKHNCLGKVYQYGVIASNFTGLPKFCELFCKLKGLHRPRQRRPTNELWIFWMERDGYRMTIKAAWWCQKREMLGLNAQQPHHLAHHSQTEASEYPQKGSTWPVKLTHCNLIHQRQRHSFLLAKTARTQRFNLFYLSAT